MAKQIIVTQGDTGIELSVQFVDDKKKPVDITGKEIEVNFVNPNEELYETMYAQIVDGTQGIASIILTDKHTSITDLHKTYWACMDNNGYVTAQTDLFYYVKEKLGGSSITESNGELNIDGFIEGINKIIEEQEYHQSLIENNANNIQNNANSITSLHSETSKIKDLAEENKAKINSFVEQDTNTKLLNEITNARQGENALVDNINKIKDSITNHNHDTQYAKPSDITTLTNNFDTIKQSVTSNTNEISDINKEVQQIKNNKNAQFDSIQLGTSSTQINGYTTLPNGLVLQWGSTEIEVPSKSSKDKSIQLPIAFQNSFLNVQANVSWNRTNNSYAGLDYVHCNAIKQGNDRLIVIARNIDTAFTGNKVLEVCWMAIGY